MEGVCIHPDENITAIIAPWRADLGHLLHVCSHVAVSGRKDAISQTETAFCSQGASGLAERSALGSHFYFLIGFN